MKLTLYRLEQGFILTSDEQVKGDCYGLEFDLLWQNPKLFKWESDIPCSPESNCRKVIAQPGEIDLSGLSEVNQKKIGWIDIEKIYPTGQGGLMSMPTRDEFNNSLRQEGFQKAQEIMDEMFTKEQFYEFMSLHTDAAPISYLKREFEKFISDKSWRVKIEMESVNLAEEGNRSNSSVLSNCNNWVSIPKFTDGKIKILDIL